MDAVPFSPAKHAIVADGKRLRIGLLVDSVMASQYVYDFAVWAQSQQNVALSSLIVVNARERIKASEGIFDVPLSVVQPARSQGLSRTLSRLAFRAVERVERALISKDKHHFIHLRSLDLSSLVKDMVRVAGIESDSGVQLESSSVGKLKALDLDLILQCGPSHPGRELLGVSRLGVFAVRCGDPEVVRGDPAGFWEVYHRHETTGFAILRLRENRDVGDTLVCGHVATRHYYLLNQAFVLRKAYHHLRRLVERIALAGKLPDPLPSFPYAQRMSDMPRLSNLLAYAGRRLSSIVLKRLRRLLKIEYRSTVAFVRDSWTDAVLANGVKLLNRPMHYLADPFVIWRDGRAYCFVEDLDYATQRGCIDVYELTKDGGVRLGTALQEGFHLSFPYLFEYGSELYMCPESSSNRDIRIYKCLTFPLQWELATIAMQNVSAVDSMIFEREGRWWTLTNIDPVGIDDHCSELHIYSASSPLANDWKPHPLNPVLIDASRARNAGYLTDGSRFYRCSQGQGFDFYGKRVLINEILELTETSYRESLSSTVTPSFGNRAAGTHHLHSDGRSTVFDFVTISRIGI